MKNKHWYLKCYSFLASINLILSPFIGLILWIIHLQSGGKSFWDLPITGMILMGLITVLLFTVSIGSILKVYYLSQKEKDRDPLLSRIFGK